MAYFFDCAGRNGYARFIAGLAVILATCLPSRGQTSTQQVAAQFREYCLQESTDQGERLLDDVELPKTSTSQALKLLEAMKPDGSWGDVDYLSNAKSSWPACNHLTRVLALTVYARRAGTAPAESARCIAGVHRALTWWETHDYQCPNWWYNQIGVPKILGNVALLLNNDLTAGEKRYVADTVLARAKIGAMTGQNRVWLAANGAMRAALLSDAAMMRQAASVIQEELTVGTAEGIQPDWSFQQHGPQQQFGNYGMAYAVEMCRWATVLRGTPWAFAPEKLAILRQFLLGGENWVIWRGVMDISACGRQLFPGSPASKAGVVRGTMRAMAVADAEHAKGYAAFVGRNSDGAVNDLAGDQYFWRSDYLAHRQHDWMATLKMSSNRVIGGETVNSENLSGLYLADGATYFYRSGHEYEDIFPAWNWRMIPGVTSGIGEESLQWPKADLTKAPAFVGGVSDGTASVAAMDFHRNDVRAKKAWFFDGDEMICLGADISATGGEEVVTTINQCLLNGSATFQRDGRAETLASANQNLDAAQWVEQDGLRYTPLEKESLKWSAASASGNWSRVFMTPATPKGDVTKDIFTLWISHGTNPNGATYSYGVEPLLGREDNAAARIVSNSRTLQAVAKGDWTGAVFWVGGAAELRGVLVRVDSPCLLLLDGSHVVVSDPTEHLASIRVDIAGKSYVVTLPQGGDAGKSVAIDGVVLP